jgi:hypothetical protein
MRKAVQATVGVANLVCFVRGLLDKESRKMATKHVYGAKGIPGYVFRVFSAVPLLTLSGAFCLEEDVSKLVQKTEEVAD